MGRLDRIKHAWNAFSVNEQPPDPFAGLTTSLATSMTTSSVRPDRMRGSISNERSIVTAIYTRIAIDFASIAIRHVRLDEDDRYESEIQSGLNSCLRLEANLDQSARAFRQDLAQTLFDVGTIAIVPVDVTVSPLSTGGYDILNLRIGRIVSWMPKHVKVNLYNERTGKREDVTLEKKFVGIVENPFYSIMNETSSTLQRLIRKLNILDAIDEQTGSGKLDLIIQLPYVIKSESRREQAIKRRDDIEFQLRGSKHGIAYADGTEKITQLNRPVENNIMPQIEYLVAMLYGQLGLTDDIMNGTADEKTMLNYLNRTIEPLLDAVVEEMRRKFLTKTARTQGQSVEYFRDPFKLVPIASIAEIADKFARNEILASNEIRQAIGYKPVKDGKSDRLVNSNMPQAAIEGEEILEGEVVSDEATVMTDALDSVDKMLDDVFAELGVDENDYQ